MLAEKTLHRLKRLLAEIARLRLEQIDTSEPLESYGINSVMMMQLNHELAEVFGETVEDAVLRVPDAGGAGRGIWRRSTDLRCTRWAGLRRSGSRRYRRQDRSMAGRAGSCSVGSAGTLAASRKAVRHDTVPAQ